MTPDIEPTESARSIAAQLFDRLTLSADGLPFDESNPDTWENAENAEPEIVRLGATRFRILDANAKALGVAAGAIELGEVGTLCMRVAFEEVDGAPAASIGQYVSVLTAEGEVAILFRVWLTYSDLHDPVAPYLGTDAMCNEVLQVLEPGQGLLVQVFQDDEEEAA